MLYLLCNRSSKDLCHFTDIDQVQIVVSVSLYQTIDLASPPSKYTSRLDCLETRTSARAVLVNHNE